MAGLPDKFEVALGAWNVCGELIGGAAPTRAIALRPGTAEVVQLVYLWPSSGGHEQIGKPGTWCRQPPPGSEQAPHLGIGIAQLDSDVPLQFVLEPDGVHPRDGFHHRGLPMGHMADGA